MKCAFDRAIFLHKGTMQYQVAPAILIDQIGINQNDRVVSISVSCFDLNFQQWVEIPMKPIGDYSENNILDTLAETHLIKFHLLL